MVELYNSFIRKTFLRSVWNGEYEAFVDSPDEAALLNRLGVWADRKDLKETSAEAAFIEQFLRDTWGYVQSGQEEASKGFTLVPKYPVEGAGAKGGTGEADLAVGLFSQEGTADISAHKNLLKLKAICR